MPFTDRRSPDYLQNLYAYNEWANHRVLAAAAVIEERLRDEVTPGASAPLANLMHVLQAQASWLSFWRGVERERLPAAPAHGAAEWLRDQFQRSHEQLRLFVDSLGEQDVEGVLEHRAGGKTRRWALWQLMMHVVNHGTQHRAETALSLTALGSSPGDLDYGHFCDVRASQTSGTLAMMRTLYAYNEWADNRIVEALSGLSDSELLRPRGLSHESLGMDLLHLLLAQRGWLSIWEEGAPVIPLPGAGTGRHLDNLVDGLARAHAAIRTFIDDLSDEELGRPRVDNPDGANPSVVEGRRLPLWDMMVHVVNHSTQHRAEAATALTALGRSPRDLDLDDFLVRS
ncbi:MAG: DinB family protein [Chloroflexota bacterium]|nr:DinB family protein [Chloroflexota bacterium]